MSERKSWTQMEDKVLKQLRLECGDKKWSEIAQIMRTQHGIQGRNGKQCRERYHNHLDQRISKSIWKDREDQLLLTLHNKFGNRWANIARAIQGRTDNCVKNRFYSRFRKSIRVINQMIKIFWKKQFKPLKITFITKIIEFTQQFRDTEDQGKKSLLEITQNLKCRLMSFADCNQQLLRGNNQRMTELHQLIRDINNFNKKNKRRGKKKKRENADQQQQEENIIDVKLNNKKAKLKKHSDKYFKIVKIQPQSVPVKNEHQRYPTNLFQIPQKIQQIKNQQNVPDNFASCVQIKEQQKVFTPIVDGIQYVNDKKIQSFYTNNDIMYEGFDINQFYSLQNLYPSQNFYYY